jgi:hypothetical protein
VKIFHLLEKLGHTHMDSGYFTSFVPQLSGIKYVQKVATFYKSLYSQCPS